MKKLYWVFFLSILCSVLIAFTIGRQNDVNIPSIIFILFSIMTTCILANRYISEYFLKDEIKNNNNISAIFGKEMCRSILFGWYMTLLLPFIDGEIFKNYFQSIIAIVIFLVSTCVLFICYMAKHFYKIYNERRKAINSVT